MCHSQRPAGFGVQCAISLLAVAAGAGGVPVAALAAEVAGVSLITKSVAGGTPVQVGIGLDGPAPFGGQVVTLRYSTTSVLDRPPAAVKIPGGATNGSFVLATLPTPATATVKFSASAGTVLRYASLTVRKPEVKALLLERKKIQQGVTPMIPEWEDLGSSASGGVLSRLTITLDGAAPTAGTAVLLQLSPYTAFQLCNTDPIRTELHCSPVSSQNSIIFAAGEASKVYQLLLGPVRDTQNLSITASAGVPKSLTLRLHQPAVSHVVFAPSCDSPHFWGISAVASPTNIVARIYTKQKVPTAGAYAALSLAKAAAPISPTVELSRQFYWNPNVDECSSSGTYTSLDGGLLVRLVDFAGCLNASQSGETYHVGCVPIPADAQGGAPRRLTLTATTGDRSGTATLDVGPVN